MIRLIKNSILLFLLLFVFQNCNKDSTVVIPAFYHWKTNFEIDKNKGDYLQQVGVKHLYVKFFDVDWQNNEAIPLAEVQFYTQTNGDGITVIPTIFITNRTFKHVSTEKELAVLAENIVAKVKTIAQTNSIDIHEIQFDCDWTESTRASYFSFLERVQELFPSIILSATIRLHQVKYAKRTGVPPVAKGVLMFYNMGDLEDIDEPNSILNLEKAKKYIGGMDNYPIHLDLALPLFAWGVVFREDKFINLINGLDETMLADTSRFKKITTNIFEIKKSTYLQGYYFYKGDSVKIEVIRQADLVESAHLLKDYFKNDTTRILFYHLDTKIINNHSYENIKEILDVF